ncbi:ABC transporter substrate-binding protein [Tuberibacillus sp. Marseille-P3662]|uniref:ABC transporter substrate-binding protein n=1 Tax=Tuberibacillus sp. Marseille-P3662 TaxID=1965358 RepID=UPI000A1C839F|nr:ABC transporter substrate-binding protein [Tuberibacillus sp. Marseille-P3662]
MKKWLLFSITAMLIFAVTACGNSEGASSEGSGDSGSNKQVTLDFADAGWDSIRLHNEIAGTIIEEGYGYKTSVTPGNTPVTFQGLVNGDIDIYMEVWTGNIKEDYQKAIDEGSVKKTSVNFDDNTQGLYVPTYMIKGDEKRGIDPVAPDLKTVEDLKKYPDLFKGPSGKPRIVGSPPGWEVDKILGQKVKTYGLDKQFEYFHPGSQTALTTSLSKAYEAGEPWVGYYWTPTWVMGKYDMTLLKEDEYSDEKWNNGYACEFPSNQVVTAATDSLEDKAPKVVEFLNHYKTSSSLTNEGLLYMQKNDAGAEEAAKWWLKQHEDLWTKWVPEAVAKKVKKAL